MHRAVADLLLAAEAAAVLPACGSITQVALQKRAATQPCENTGGNTQTITKLAAI